MILRIERDAPPGATSNEARNRANGSGPSIQTNHNAKSIGAACELQGVADRLTVFKRLQRAFDAAGWNYHYLNGDACLAVHRKWQMSQVCPDHRSAFALLKRVGGATE